MPKVQTCCGGETSQGLTYAKAARKVSMQSNIPISKVISAEINKMKPCEGCSKVKKHSPIAGKNEFILSVVEVWTVLHKQTRRQKRSESQWKQQKKISGNQEYWVGRSGGNVQRRSAQLTVTSAKETIPKSTMSRGERNVPWWVKTAGKQLK